ncbi:MAG: hypothetical protein ACK56F_09160, partial [bacterium]
SSIVHFYIIFRPMRTDAQSVPANQNPPRSLADFLQRGRGRGGKKCRNADGGGCYHRFLQVVRTARDV